MRSKDPLLPLKGILQNIELIRLFTRDLSYEEFLEDRKTVYAVTRALEIISEAARKVPEEIVAKHPQVPWTNIKGAGNIYRHDYEDVLESMLWETVEHGLGPLETAAKVELKK